MAGRCFTTEPPQIDVSLRGKKIKIFWMVRDLKENQGFPFVDFLLEEIHYDLKS